MTRCPRPNCGGVLLLDGDNRDYCNLCGRSASPPSPPPPPEKRPRLYKKPRKSAAEVEISALIAKRQRAEKAKEKRARVAKWFRGEK